jgi:peptide/nickel transport system substrate-binding protein
MRRTAFQLVAISTLVFAAASGQARTRPAYGGNLRVTTAAAANGQLTAEPRFAGLLLETLVTIDDAGALQPMLATSWEAQNDAHRWQFWLGRNVKFHDGSPLTPAAVAEWLGRIPDQRWRVRALGESVVFEAVEALPHLAAEMALPQYAIGRTVANGTVVGTGPFRVENGPKLVFGANEDYWDGAPFIRRIEVAAGRPLREQFTDLVLDRADVVELSAEQLRRAQNERIRTESSQPVETIVLLADPSRPELRDARVRQALALCIDRAAIHNVLLQKQGEIAAGLLPNWVTGYGFLFNTAPDLGRARQLRNEPRQLVPLTLTYDSNDSLERLIAERVALNAQEAGFTVQTASSGQGDLRIERLALASLDPAVALAEALRRHGATPPAALDTAEARYNAERDFLRTFAAIPLVHIPRSFALRPRLRNWTMRPDGTWGLQKVWLEGAP